MKKETAIVLAGLVAVVTFLLFGCSTPTKLERVRNEHLRASLALSRNEAAEERRVIRSGNRDTIRVRDASGENELILMKAIRDEETGEMVANDVIDAAVITARFRNVAERHGRVDLRFEVLVPQEMVDSKWQLRFYPDMFILEDSIRLDPVLITGEQYRKAQLRGYELYERYLRSIIRDSSAFVDWRNLDIWVSRNVKELAKYKYSEELVEVDVDNIESFLGPTVADAVRHYTLWTKKARNDYKWATRKRKFNELVKAPIITEGIRLDTVLRDVQGNFVYQYTQSIKTRPKLRKVDIVLSGDIYESAQRLYTMPRSEPLTFYISSLSAFVDNTERYITKVTERRVGANATYNVDFAQGKHDIDPSLSNNREELGRIRSTILNLLDNKEFDLDSVTIAASASPEGSVPMNNTLSEKRAASVAAYFDRYIKHYRDSVARAERGNFSLTIGDDGVERRHSALSDIPEIKFRSRSNGENWQMLTVLVDEDTTFTKDQKWSFVKNLETADLDAREAHLRTEPYYEYMKENLYPRLRTTRFDFSLTRKGMEKDTIQTTVLDSTYMQGVEYIRQREYEKALELLRDYQDYNTAIAYVSLDYNASAMAILQNLPKTAQVNYMLALLYARNNDDEKAVQHYLESCRQEHSYVFRGNLDPEIYVLIQRYGLNKEEEGF